MEPKIGEFYVDSFQTVAVINEIANGQVFYTIILDTQGAPSLDQNMTIKDFVAMTVGGTARKVESIEQVKTLEILYGKIQKR